MGCCASTGRVGDEGAALDPKHVDLRHFDVQRTLGEGGFGKVNAVVKKSAPDGGKWYAIKMLGKRVILERRMLEEVLRELALLREVRGSRFVCAAYYAFQDEAHLYLVLDLYLGGDLRFHLNKAPQGRMTPTQVAFYGASLILALDFLHARGVLHRDIKPENVLMDSAGHVALTDLGISAKVEACPPVCAQTSGTLGYMAPEIFWEGHVHGIPSEAYSLGVLLHELATGARPFPAPIWEQLHHHGEEDAYYRSCEAAAGGVGALFKGKDSAHVPAEMQALVRQLLKPRPAQRGVGPEEGGLAALKAHTAFGGIQWEALESKEAAPPFVPPAEANVQTNVDELFGGGGDGGDPFGGGVGKKKAAEARGGAIPPSDQALFAGYNYDHRDTSVEAATAAAARKPPFVRLSFTSRGSGGSGRLSLIASGSARRASSSTTTTTATAAAAATTAPPSLLTASGASSSSRRLRVTPEKEEAAAAAPPAESTVSAETVVPIPSISIPMPEALPATPQEEEKGKTATSVPVVAEQGPEVALAPEGVALGVEGEKGQQADGGAVEAAGALPVVAE